jgi:hypothetical protein
MTTHDGIPIAVQISPPLAAGLAAELTRLLQAIGPAASNRLH